MEPKYYTPTKQEIIEHFINEGYIETTDDQISRVVSSGGIVDNLYKFIEMNDKSSVYGFDINPKLYRIKYLDKEDIESFGFIVDEMYGDTEFEYKNELKLPAYEYKSKVYLRYDYTSKICYLGTPGMTVFHGIIKNKSELKKILKMIGVIE